MNGETVVTRTPEETLRRYVGAVERVMNDVRERQSHRSWRTRRGAAARIDRAPRRRRRRKRRRKTDEWSLFITACSATRAT